MKEELSTITLCLYNGLIIYAGYGIAETYFDRSSEGTHIISKGLNLEVLVYVTLVASRPKAYPW